MKACSHICARPLQGLASRPNLRHHRQEGTVGLPFDAVSMPLLCSSCPKSWMLLLMSPPTTLGLYSLSFSGDKVPWVSIRSLHHLLTITPQLCRKRLKLKFQYPTNILVRRNIGDRISCGLRIALERFRVRAARELENL